MKINVLPHLEINEYHEIVKNYECYLMDQFGTRKTVADDEK